VSDLALQSNSQIVISGSFDAVNGSPRTNIARLNSNGTLDSTFVAELTLRHMLWPCNWTGGC